METKGHKADPLYVVATDTDSPHRLLTVQSNKPINGYPLTPGLSMCGSTSSVEGVDFMYIYRIGLIAQAISNNIISSKIKGKYSPFVFLGLLSPFGYSNAAIPTGEMGNLRYKGNIDLKKEFLHQYNTKIERLMD